MYRILVIDDEPFMKSMIIDLLKRAGYKAKGAENGEQGLKFLDAQRFDLIVTDIVMPEIQGTEMIEVIRTINKTIPIIAISGGARTGPEDYLETAGKLGANYTFQKPFQNAAFLEAVLKCLALV